MTFAETLPSSATPASVLTPKADLFAQRAARLRVLASDHSLGAWLNWLADLADAQQKALAAAPALDLHFDGLIDSSKPLLAIDNSQLDQAWQAVYRELTVAMDVSAPELDANRLSLKGRQCIAHAAGSAVEVHREVSDLIVAAALQVVWLAGARQLALPEFTQLEHRDCCPCCGSAPVASIVLAGTGNTGLRYLECGLCATRWNAVRARCTFCADGSVVNYWSIEGGNEAVQAETCDQCHGYIKTFFQSKDLQLDPLGDDLASLALDVLVGEQGFARGAPNPLLIEGDCV